MEYRPLNIWDDILRVHVEEINIVYEKNKIVGIHADWENVFKEIDSLCSKLQAYKSKMLSYYGLSNTQDTEFKLTFIYLIKDNHTGFYKIGRSINPEFRERTLLSQAPAIETIFISPETSPSNETLLHSFFSDKRKRWEWFNLNESDILFIKNFNYGFA